MIQNMASTGFRKVSMNMVDLTKLTFSQTSLGFFYGTGGGRRARQ